MSTSIEVDVFTMTSGATSELANLCTNGNMLWLWFVVIDFACSLVACGFGGNFRIVMS